MSVQDLIVLRGRAASEVVIHKSDDPEGKGFGRFRMAVPRARRRDDGEWEEAEPQWYTVKAWGALADHLGFSIRRGSPVLVIGRPVAQAWINKDGEAQGDLAIHAVSVGHDLVFGVANFSRLRKQTVEPEPETAALRNLNQTDFKDSGEVLNEESQDEDDEAQPVLADSATLEQADSLVA